MASLLPLPDDLQVMIDEWPQLEQLAISLGLSPRSAWLTQFERQLALVYPSSSSRDRKLTARHYAPFPLAAGKDVP